MAAHAAAEEKIHLTEKQLDEFFRNPEVILNIRKIDRNKKPGPGRPTRSEEIVFRHFKKLHPEIEKANIQFRTTLFEMHDKYVEKHPDYLHEQVIDDEPLDEDLIQRIHDFVDNEQPLQPLSKNEIKFNTSLTKKLIKLKTAKNFDETYDKSGLPKKQRNYYKNLVENLRLDELKQFREYQLKNVDKKMENARDSKLDKENKKLKILKVALENAENELQKKKIQRKINKVKDVKQQKKLRIDMNKLIENPDEKLKNNIVDNVSMNSYIPNKFIPLYIKNKNGPGYHRITGEEIAELKKDPSGDYYDGTGIQNIFTKFKLPINLPDKRFIKAVHPEFDPDNNKYIGLKLQSQGGSLIGLIKPHFGPRPVVNPVYGNGNIPSQSTASGTFINTNYKPQMINKPFSIGW